MSQSFCKHVNRRRETAFVPRWWEPVPDKESFTCLWDDDQKVGMALRSRTEVNPIFISPGHRLSFEDPYRLTMQCPGRYKHPEPIRSAHRWVHALRKGEVGRGFKRTR